MKKLMKTGLFALSLLALASCGGNDAESEDAAGGIDTKDVKGDIDLMGAKGGELNYSYNGQACKAYKVEIGETAELIIYPSTKSIDEETGDIERRVKSSFYDVEIINDKDDFIFFKETKTPWNSEDKEAEKPGYGFIGVVKKDDKTNYILKSSGENPLDPIWSKADAEKLLKIAKSFRAKG